MKFMKIAKGSFHKFHMTDHSCKILYLILEVRGSQCVLQLYVLRLFAGEYLQSDPFLSDW